MSKVLYCDIDGTVADLSHRLYFIDEGRHIRKYDTDWDEGVPPFKKDWDSFFEAVKDDKPIVHIIESVRQFEKLGWWIVMMTGRPEHTREATLQWLHDNSVPADHMYMRTSHDLRPDYVIKDELFRRAVHDGYEPTLVIDDRQQVVDMWRSHGIPCIQVAAGNY